MYMYSGHSLVFARRQGALSFNEHIDVHVLWSFSRVC